MSKFWIYRSLIVLMVIACIVFSAIARNIAGIAVLVIGAVIGIVLMAANYKSNRR
ncbi:hypothetical protein [Bacillus sp. OV322]|uniref:hypothetical protein n=1 Tax=Bacillus sp. OV322 TaxID=1882764 RepID=UPI0015A715B2|nr:hypothetical protein [Bacillus sp. OV322]